MAFRHNSTLADREPDWGTVDKSRLPRAAFADPGEEGQKSTWKYPHHWIQNGGDPDENGIWTTGTMYLHGGGLDAAWSAAQGGRTGQKAAPAVIDRLQAHRKALGKDEGKGQGISVRAEADGETLTLWIYDVIDMDDFWGGTSAKQIARELKAYPDATTIIININSVGGSVWGGLAIYNVLHRHAARKIVNVDGVALSAASAVAMVGDEIRMAENAMLMIHNAWALVAGDSVELVKAAERLDKVDETLRRTYAARTGNEVEQIGDWMREETWFTAEEALEKGFATAITPAKKVAAMADPAALGRFGYRHIPEHLSALLGSDELTPRPGGSGGPLAMDRGGEAGPGTPTKEQETMDKDKNKTPGPGPVPATDPPAPVATDPPVPPGAEATPGTERDRIAQQTLAADRTRREGIMALVEEGLDREAAQDWCDEGVTLAEARRLAGLAQRMRPLAVAPGARVEGGADRNLSTISPGIEDALCLRAGVPLLEMDASGEVVRDEQGRPKRRAAHPRAAKFRGLSIGDMACQYLAAVGVPEALSLSRPQAIEMVLDWRRQTAAGVLLPLALTSADFTHILGNTVNRSLRAEYELTPVSWTSFCERDTNPDFKERAITALSEAPDLLATDEGGDVRMASFVDNGRSIRVAKFMRGIKLTREMMVNDDLGAFRRIPRLYGQRARGKEDDVAYALIVANGAIDGGPLFNATPVTTPGGHANHVDAGAVPSVATLDVGFAMMGVQRGMQTVQDGDAGPAFLNLIPTVLLVPTSLRGTALALVSLLEPLNPNIYKGGLHVESNARLQASDAHAWYLMAPSDPPADVVAAPRGTSTIVVCFLESQQAPVTRQEQNLKTLDVEIVCEHIVAAAVVDWRGMFKNDGQ
jgi:ATP-dependent protease ClpP protease subunit